MLLTRTSRAGKALAWSWRCPSMYVRIGSTFECAGELVREQMDRCAAERRYTVGLPGNGEPYLLGPTAELSLATLMSSGSWMSPAQC